MSELKFELSEDTDSTDSKRIFEGLVAFNDSKVEKSIQRGLVIAVKNSSGELIGGVKAQTHRGWLYVHQLWVSESIRSTGLGSKLIKMTEAEAIRRGCIGAHLNTYSFQALDFYRKHGYEIFGELNDFPVGHKNLFLKKNLKS